MLKSKVITRFIAGLGIFLFIISIAFEALPLMSDTTIGTFRLMTRQRVFEQSIVKNALILYYRPSLSERSEAISELQTTLPVWEKVQIGLQNGSPSLGISSNLPSDVNTLIMQAQPDYVYLDAAVHQILAHTGSIDVVQLSIILQHDQPYYVAMGQTTNLFQEHIQDATKIYFIIQLCISMPLMLICLGLLFRMKVRQRPSTV